MLLAAACNKAEASMLLGIWAAHKAMTNLASYVGCTSIRRQQSGAAMLYLASSSDNQKLGLLRKGEDERRQCCDVGFQSASCYCHHLPARALCFTAAKPCVNCISNMQMVFVSALGLRELNPKAPTS